MIVAIVISLQLPLEKRKASRVQCFCLRCVLPFLAMYLWWLLLL